MTITILRADAWLRTSSRAVPFDAMDNLPVTKTPTVSVALLFDRFADGLYTLGYRILGDRHLAEDVVQETFIKVMRSLDTYRGDGPIAAWLYRIGYREAITATRRRRETPLAPDEMLETGDRPITSVEDAVLASELTRRLDAAIARLAEPLRSAFVLRDIEQLSTSEVAQTLDVSESAVKMRLARARQALRVDLKEYLA
jgi:RNA polymerase sigma-70 factor (ECF subfamily)